MRTRLDLPVVAAPERPARLGHTLSPLALAIGLSLGFGAAPAWAQEGLPPSLPEAAAPADPEAAEEAESPEALATRVQALTEQVRQMEQANQDRAASAVNINGYLDLGFFKALGNRGAGWRQDFRNEQYPKYADHAWTFVGDVLATSVNSRGEAADLGDAPGADRFDSIDSNGAATFLVNELNLRLGYQVWENAIARASVNFVPRTGRDFRLGDFMDVDLAELEYVLTDDGNTSIFVGKTLPVFGIEYKDRKSDQRFGITPSLLHRYTSGPQLGVKFRTKLLREVLVIAASATNNSSSTEQFHFQSEIDRNDGKTLNGRLALGAPLGRVTYALEGHRVEVGVSGEWGSQDFASDERGKIWFFGVDLQYTSTDFSLKAQGIRGGAPGRAAQGAWELKLRNSGYLELDWQALARLGILLRAEARDAFVAFGLERAYVTKEARFTGGLRFVLSPRAVLKLEYLHNRELRATRQFNNDVITSSLVLGF